MQPTQTHLCLQLVFGILGEIHTGEGPRKLAQGQAEDGFLGHRRDSCARDYYKLSAGAVRIVILCQAALGLG